MAAAVGHERVHQLLRPTQQPCRSLARVALPRVRVNPGHKRLRPVVGVESSQLIARRRCAQTVDLLRLWLGELE
eukprot:5002843-Prymnesium_polylepis.1